MTFLQRLKWAISGKASDARVLVAQVNGGRPVFTEAKYEKLAEEGYNKNAIVFRCVSLISDAVKQVDWCLYQKARGRNKTPIEITDNPLLELLARPNPMAGKTAFFEAVAAYYLLAGNSYIEAVGPSPTRPPLELWTQRPDRMTIVSGAAGVPSRYIYKYAGREKVWDVDILKRKSPMLHLKTFHPTNDWYGLSRIQAAAMATDAHNDASKWNVGLLQNSARPSGMLVMTASQGNPSGTLTDDQFRRLKTQMDEQYQGASNAGRPMLLEGGLDWRQIAMTPAEMDWLNGKNVSAREIGMVFSVPSMLLGLPGDNKYANYKEARLAMYEEGVLPICDFIRDELNHWLTPIYGDRLFLDYDRDSIDALAPKRSELWDQTEKSTILTTNEKRERLGFSPVEGGDVVLVQSSMVPLEYAATVDPAESDLNAQEDGDPVDPNKDPSEDAPEKKPIEEGVKARKFVALKNPKDRALEWRRQQKLRVPFERRLKGHLASLFSMEGIEVAKAVDGLDPHLAEQEAIRVIEGNRAKLKTVISHAHIQAGTAFGKRVLSQIKSLPGGVETKDLEDSFSDAFARWINKYIGTRVTDIEQSTKDLVVAKIRSAGQDTIDEGEGAVPFADRIKSEMEELYDGFETYRADRIARTETVTASNVAQKTAAQASGVPGLQKEWLSAEDERTRDSHAKADGEIIEMDGLFKVGGIEMDHPADPNGPPEEVINCRCTLAIVPPDGSEEE